MYIDNTNKPTQLKELIFPFFSHAENKDVLCVLHVLWLREWSVDSALVKRLLKDDLEADSRVKGDFAH